MEIQPYPVICNLITRARHTLIDLQVAQLRTALKGGAWQAA